MVDDCEADEFVPVADTPNADGSAVPEIWSSKSAAAAVSRYLVGVYEQAQKDAGALVEADQGEPPIPEGDEAEPEEPGPLGPALLPGRPSPRRWRLKRRSMKK